jgi:hypothetical protein
MKNRFCLVFIFLFFVFPLAATRPVQARSMAQSKDCNVATFVKDITFPDSGVGKGATLRPGAKFRKTWQIKNVGTCTWNSNYRWVFDHGHIMGGPAWTPLTSGSVKPGQSIEVSVDLTAPLQPGAYTGYWRLADDKGRDFGTTIGRSFYVTVNVSNSSSISSQTTSISDNRTNRTIYYPFRDCAPSRLFVGDYVFVSLGGGPNGIRSAPDVHPNNIFYRAQEGEGMRLLNGPKCSWGWLIWEVQTDSGYRGWTPESDGEEFWLVPVDAPASLPIALKNDPKAYGVYTKASSILQDPKLSDAQKREQIRILQSSVGEELFATVIRYVPVYDSESGKFYSFDSYMRLFASEQGHSTNQAPIEIDPVGAGLSIFFNPSVDNIQKMLGLP